MPMFMYIFQKYTDMSCKSILSLMKVLSGVVGVLFNWNESLNEIAGKEYI